MRQRLQNLTPSNLDKLFETLREDVSSEIFVGHKISPVLLGIETPGKLGQRKEVRDQFELFTKNYVLPRQAKLKRVINFIKELTHPDLSSEVVIKPLTQPQIELTEDGIFSLMDRDEARLNFLQGYELKPKPAAPVINSGKDVTGASPMGQNMGQLKNGVW